MDSPRDTKIDLINGVILKFIKRTILQHFYKDKDYFKFNIKLESNIQNEYNENMAKKSSWFKITFYSHTVPDAMKRCMAYVWIYIKFRVGP